MCDLVKRLDNVTLTEETNDSNRKDREVLDTIASELDQRVTIAPSQTEPLSFCCKEAGCGRSFLQVFLCTHTIHFTHDTVAMTAKEPFSTSKGSP